MTNEKIARINELAKKSKTTGMSALKPYFFPYCFANFVYQLG